MEEPKEPSGPPLKGEGAPPVIVPPVTQHVAPQYHNPPPSPYAPPKPSSVGPWIGLGVALVIVAIVIGLGRMSQRSGVVVNGREMSRAEVDQMADEVSDLAKDVKPGDPFSIDTQKPVTSKLAKKIQETAIISQRLEKDLERAGEDVDFEVLLSAKQLGTVVGRTQSREKLEKYDVAVVKYFEGSIKVLKGLEAWTVQEMGRAPEVYDDRLGDTELMFKKNKEMMKTALELVAVAQKARAEYDSKSDQLMMEADKDIEEYNRLNAKLVAVSTEIETLTETITKKREAQIAKDLEILRGG